MRLNRLVILAIAASTARIAEVVKHLEAAIPFATEPMANAIDVVIEAGDAGPVTPVGISYPRDLTTQMLEYSGATH